MNNLPRISIVTPSYNYGRFIGQTIDSVIQQAYPNLEYIIMDGASTDDTKEVIERYSNHLSYWESTPDNGAAHAINKGIKKSTGELFNWLNADDWLLPGTLLSLGTIASKYPDYDMYAFIGAQAGVIGPIVLSWLNWLPMHYYLVSNLSCFAQESTFIRYTFLEDNKLLLQENLNWAFDTILYEDMLFRNARVLFIDVLGGVIRHHPAAKTTIGMSDEECANLSLLRRRGSNRQKIWRRLNATRFSMLQRMLCNYRPTRTLVSFLLGQASNQSAICSLRNWDPCDPACWHIQEF